MAGKPQPLVPHVVRVPRTDAVYNCHAYPTKVPVRAIVPFIEAFTQTGDLVVDPFAGSGMTGLASAMAGRKAFLSDVSVLGQHIFRGYTSKITPETLERAARDVTEATKARLGGIYQTVRLSDGAPVDVSRTVWSFSYQCPKCKTILSFYDPEADSVIAKGMPCQGCGHPFERRTWERGPDAPRKVAIRDIDGRLIEQPVGEHDFAAIALAKEDSRLNNVPSALIHPDREMFRRSALARHDLTETKAFFSQRNAIALYELHQQIMAVRDETARQKLLFAFTAILTRASRRYQWGPKRPLNAQNQTYYIAPVYYEWNIFELFSRKIEAIRRSDALLSSAGALGDDADIHYEVTSATNLDHLQDESADYVFTDPPFGGNIFYSDMSLFHEVWLDRLTDPSYEAVIKTRQKEAEMLRYEELMTEALRECFRVLRGGASISIVFGNSLGAVWGIVQRAIAAAGFVEPPTHVSLLDKGQRSVKGLASGSERVSTADVVLTFQKPVRRNSDGQAVPVSRQMSAQELADRAVKDVLGQKVVNPSYVYAAAIARAFGEGTLVTGFDLGTVVDALMKAGFGMDRSSGLAVSASAKGVSVHGDGTLQASFAE